MDGDSEINYHNDLETSFPTAVSKVDDKETKSILLQSNKKDPNLKSVMQKPKESEKIRNHVIYQRKYFEPYVAKKKSAPIHIHMSNPTAEVVLRERKVEIKDLESQVVYLRKQLKELRIENKTLLDLQTRHEKELKRFKGGVADIPSMLRSHKDEIKAVESNASSLRRELKDCQRDLKARNDLILKKDQQLDKLNLILKRNDKHLQEVITANKELKLHNKKFEEESKKLSGGNDELKSKNERLQKKIQQMTGMMLNLEEKLGSVDHFKTQLKEDLGKLQKKYDELKLSEVALKESFQSSRVTISTQTDSLETISVSCMTADSIYDVRCNGKVMTEEFEELKNLGNMNIIDKTENSLYCGIEDRKNLCIDFPFKVFPTDISNTKLDPKMQQKLLLKPMNEISSIPMKMFEKRCGFIYGKEDSKNIKCFSSNGFELETDNFVNKDLCTKKLISMENRDVKKNYDEDCSMIHASLDYSRGRNSVLNTESPKHKNFSNLTLKQTCNVSDWINS